MTTVNATIAYNTADGAGEGGGLDVAGGTATLYNTIVALNTDSSDSGSTADDIVGSVSKASSYNLIGVGGSGGLTVTNSTGNLFNVAGAKVDLDSGLADNGGPTQTVALLPASYAIDAGSASIPGVTVPTVDQRGAPRSGGIDIGAYQLAATSGNSSYVDSTWAGDAGWHTGLFPRRHSRRPQHRRRRLRHDPGWHQRRPLRRIRIRRGRDLHRRTDHHHTRA